MASTPSKRTNLFDGTSPVASVKNGGGDGNNSGNGSNNAAASSSWFEEDDERLLSRMLLGDKAIYNSEEDGGDLDARLRRLRDRLEQDMSRTVASGEGGGGDGWWNAMLGSVTSSGFACLSPSPAAGPSTIFTVGGINAATGGGGGKELPKSFNTTDGQAHLKALVDLLGISQERAVKITLTSLRSFASMRGGAYSATAAPTRYAHFDPVKSLVVISGNENENDEGNNDESNEQGARLRSLLGTKALFQRVLLRHRWQFLMRIRAITESLRLEQECKAEEVVGTSPPSLGSKGVGESCRGFLDALDSKLTINGKKRGLFQLLLRLAMGPPLPGMGGGNEVPYSVSLLHVHGATESIVSGGFGVGGGLADGEASLLAIRAEASEALLVLLYDRIDGGVRREDLFMILEAASRCAECEFGMTARDYAITGGNVLRGNGEARDYAIRGVTVLRGNGVVPRAGQIGRPQQQSLEGGALSPTMVITQMRHRLDGLLALICAECMGLWRATNSNNSNEGSMDWVAQHPFFLGLNLAATIEDSNSGIGSTSYSGGKRGIGLPLENGAGNSENISDPNKQAQKEIYVLCQKLRQLGETVRDRRQVVYSACKKIRDKIIKVSDNDEDGELWGVHAPESVALLAFGLLLRLVHLSHPKNVYSIKMGGWGSECARMANDECGAFAYLHRVLEWMVLDPLRDTRVGSGWHALGDDALVSDLWKRCEVEMAVNDKSLALVNAGVGDNSDGDNSKERQIVSDASSVLYASIGREILSATVRAFRDALLSLQLRLSAVENISMLTDLASVVYRNERILCESFWLDWDDFCQRSEDMQDGGDHSGGDEPMCYLLDASHTLAVHTLEELKNTEASQQEIIHYLKPLSTFLHLITSLCAGSSMVQSVLTSEFLPQGLVPIVMSVVAALGKALAPLVSSPNEAIDGQVTAEDRLTIRHSTLVLQSISTLAYLGGVRARDWICQSFLPCDKNFVAGPQTICCLAFQVLPHHQSSLEGECSALSSAALTLLADLSVDANTVFQMEACVCFSSSSGGIFFGGDAKMSGFAPFISGGTQSQITHGAVSVLNCLTVNLIRNVFDPTSVSSGRVPDHIKTIGSGVMIVLDLLTTMISSGEVSFPTSREQVATTHAILSTTVAMLVGLKQVIYLHEEDGVRSIALATRNDIIGVLSSSTPLGQVIAFLASAPMTLNLMKQASNSREMSRVMDSASYHAENKQDEGKYGAWGRFVTPKRASQRVSRRRAGMKRSLADLSTEDNSIDDGKEEGDSGLYKVVAMSLSLLLVWGEQAEDIASVAVADNGSPDGQDLLLQNSPCTLLLSRSSPSSLQSHLSPGLNAANLNLLSHFVSVDNIFIGGIKCDAALLSSKVIKMCLRHTHIAKCAPHDSQRSVGLNAFRIALGGGSHIFRVLLSALEDEFPKFLDSSSRSGEEIDFEGMQQLVIMTSIILETVAVSISEQPDLARSILLGGENTEDWRLVDNIVMCVKGTSCIINASHENESAVDDRVLNLCCQLTCACLHVVDELWTTCRLTCKRNSNLDSVHACGIITSYLTNADNKTGGMTTLIVNLTVELTRCVLMSIMSLEEKNSVRDELSTSVVNQKCILLDLLTWSLDIITKEAVTRIQTKSHGGIKFVKDLFDSGPLECWKVLLSSADAAASAASSWVSGFTASIGKGNAPNWNISSFLRANLAEKEIPISTWCSFGSAVRLAKALSPHDSKCTSITLFKQCNALHVLTKGEADFAASWAAFFEVIIADVIATRPRKEVYALTTVLAESALVALLSVSKSKMIAESLLSSQGLLESRDTKPVGELCSLLLYSLSVKRDFSPGEIDAPSNYQSILEMIGGFFESTNKIFAMTQIGSVSPSNQEPVCLIRQTVLASAFVLISEFEKLPQEGRSHDDIVRYHELRIGYTDLAVSALQSLRYAQLGTDSAASVEDALAPSTFGYGFGEVSEKSSDASFFGRDAAYQLLRASLSLLSRLAPTTACSSSSNLGDFQTYTYGVDFAACLEERNAFHIIRNHLDTASNIANLTYQAVHAGSSTQSVAIIHNNAVDVVGLVITFFHTLTDSGSTIVDIMLLLIDNRCFRSLIDNSLLKAWCKMWASSGSTPEVTPAITWHRGYFSRLSSQTDSTSSASKGKPPCREDPVHFIWREVINVFSSLIRSVRCQVQTYARIDDPILRQLIPVTSVALDFICAYENVLFSCFSSMAIEARVQVNLSSKGGKSKPSTLSSSIQSSSFAFTSRLLKESADISSLFAELCKGNNKNEFARQCRSIYERVFSTALDLTKITSSFLGSIGNARELFLALSSASGTLSNPAAMFEAHPLLAEGIPNARHEAIRNAHFAHSCCVLATTEDFKNSHTATTKAAETNGKDKSLEQSFQIQVNNKFIAQIEQVAGHCLFNSLTILSEMHPTFDSFISFSTEEASCLDVAAVMKPGTMVAISSRTGARQYLQRYSIQLHAGDLKYAHAVGCDKSSRTIQVEYVDSGTIEHNIPWSSIVCMEDSSRRQNIFLYSPNQSIADDDTSDQPSLGHLILALKWCRHVGLTSLNPNANHCPMHLVKCIAERAALLLCTEVLIHEGTRQGSPHDDTVRKVNMQLLDLFGYTYTENTGGLSPCRAVSNQGDKSLALSIGEDILDAVQKNLKRQLQAACLECEEELKIWEQNNSGWACTSFWGGTKRQGRRSPFRLARKTSSSDLS